MKRRTGICGLGAMGVLLVILSGAGAQEFPVLPPASEPVGPSLPDGQAGVANPPIQQPPDDAGTQAQWPAGPMPSSPSRSLSPSEDGSGYQYEWTHVNPRGGMIKSFQTTTTEEGSSYQRQQLWTAPDGTVIRQHTWNGSQVDPYNYQREKTMTLPGGRTMTHTQSRTWDSQTGTGTMERTFQGPNGQERQWSRSWAPDDGATAAAPAESIASDPAPGIGASAESVGQPEQGFFGRLKAWGKRTFGSANSGSKSRARSGFTLGAAGRNRAPEAASPRGLSKQVPGQAMPSLKGSSAPRGANAQGRSAAARAGKPH